MLNLIKKEKGFTLIELMIVVAIIGILAAIAIPQFASYRVKAFNSAAQADLRNVMTSEEAAYAEDQTYVAITTNVGAISVATKNAVTNIITSLPGAKLSKGVSLIIPSISATDYTAKTKHWQGDKDYTGSAAAGIVGVTTAAGQKVTP